MIAIIESAALANMVDSGMNADEARALLATLSPTARYEGRAYYAARTIAYATRKGLAR